MVQARRQTRPAKLRAGRGRRGTPPAEPRIRILDSAEALFAERGFYGASMRDIAKLADVVPSHVVYAFGTKEELYAATLARRIDELVHERAERLAEVEQAKKPGLEAILESYVQPLLEKVTKSSDGWRRYGQLVAQVSHQRKMFELEAMNETLEKLDERGLALIQSIRRAVPGLGPRDALFGFLFFVNAMLHIFAETGRLERMSNEKYTSRDAGMLCAALIPFCAGGFRALAK